jgi:hypothetical protein
MRFAWANARNKEHRGRSQQTQRDGAPNCRESKPQLFTMQTPRFNIGFGKMRRITVTPIAYVMVFPPIEPTLSVGFFMAHALPVHRPVWASVDGHHATAHLTGAALQGFASMGADDLRIAQLTSRLDSSPKAIYLLKLLIRRSVQQYKAYDPFEYTVSEMAVRPLNRWGDQEYALRDAHSVAINQL